MSKNCLIIEGGGFKTAFTSGILDTFITNSYDPFDMVIGVSGGSVAASYFLSKQYRFCIDAMRHLAKNEEFLNYKRTFGKQGYMDIDFLAKVASEKVPFLIDKAITHAENKNIYFVATNQKDGIPEYLVPDKNTWISKVIASSTLPFITKGKHTIDGKLYFDGGWSDALPIKWAYNQGARKITVLRTWPEGKRSTQSWSDYFGSIYFSSIPNLKEVFSNAHLKYNQSVDYMGNPPKDLKLIQISPKKILKSGTYSYSKKTIMQDYRYGLDQGLRYLQKHL